jgi:hypothetical protein
MLATVLPAVRYIRTPLTVGYMWFLVLWLAIGHRLPTASQASGVLADVYRISHAVGPAGTAVAVSVAAYVVGILLVPLSLRLIDVSGTALRALRQRFSHRVIVVMIRRDRLLRTS